MKQNSASSKLKTIKISREASDQALLNLFLLVGIFSLSYFFREPQLLIGTLVNFAITFSAYTNKHFKTSLPIIIMPSVAAFMGSWVLASFNQYLLFFIPFIWLSNSLQVYLLKKNISNKINWVIASIVKTTLLFCVAFVLVKFSIVPTAFLTIMGVTQLITTLVGSGAANLFKEVKE